MNNTLTMSVQEAANHLGICTKSLYALTHCDGFPAIRLGRRIRISRAGLEEWVQQQEQGSRTAVRA